MAVPWTTGCRSTRPLEDVFVDLSGERPTSAGGAQYMKIVDDYSWMGWPYFLERKFSEAEVRRSGGFREVYGGCQRYWCPVDRGVRSLGQRERCRQGGVHGGAGPPWHLPRVHTRRLPKAQRCGRAVHSYDA